MIKDTEDALMRELNGRAFAFNRVFDKTNQFTTEVLADLARFCRAHESTFHPDARVHAQMEGRREVWLRITEHLGLSPEELLNLMVIRRIKKEKK